MLSEELFVMYMALFNYIPSFPAFEMDTSCSLKANMTQTFSFCLQLDYITDRS